MITSTLLIKYTDALYSAPDECRPRYDEFRDMFSSGQILSKEWLINELKNLNVSNQTFAISGAWYGTLGMMIKSEFPRSAVTMIDIDSRCERFVKKVIGNDLTIKYQTADMYEYSYYQNIIINTSCEHIENTEEWLDKLPDDSMVVLQSNNYDIPEHINCVDTIDEFLEQTPTLDILYSGKLELPMYTRFMIIGIKRGRLE